MGRKFSFRFVNDSPYQAFRILQATFFIVPVLAGLDKFLNFLTNWSQYLSPFLLKLIDYRVEGFLIIAGGIEIIAGVGVLYKPRLFSHLISLWLFGIIINLMLTEQDYDIALHDFGLFLCSLALGSLSHKYGAK